MRRVRHARLGSEAPSRFSVEVSQSAGNYRFAADTPRLAIAWRTATGDALILGVFGVAMLAPLPVVLLRGDAGRPATVTFILAVVGAIAIALAIVQGFLNKATVIVTKDVTSIRFSGLPPRRKDLELPTSAVAGIDCRVVKVPRGVAVASVVLRRSPTGEVVVAQGLTESEGRYLVEVLEAGLGLPSSKPQADKCDEPGAEAAAAEGEPGIGDMGEGGDAGSNTEQDTKWTRRQRRR